MGVLHLLTGAHAPCGVGVSLLAAKEGVAADGVSVVLFTALRIGAGAFTVYVAGGRTGTTLGVIVLGDGAVTSSVAVGVKIKFADQGRRRGGGRACAVSGVSDISCGNAVVVGAGAKIEPLLVNEQEVINGTVSCGSDAVHVAVVRAGELAFQGAEGRLL